MDASVSHKSVSGRRPEEEPVEGAAEPNDRPEPHSDAAVAKLAQLNTPSHDAESSLERLTQVPTAQVQTCGTLVHQICFAMS